jgi:WD40 repeat protein
MALQGLKVGITAVAFSPDGKRIASNGNEKNIKVWNAETGSEIMTLLGHDSAVYCVGYSPDGKWIASGSADKTMRIWDAGTGAETNVLRGHKGTIWSLGVSPDSRRVVSGGYGVVKIWDIETGSELVTLGRQIGVYTVAFSPDGARIVSGGMGPVSQATIKVWESAAPVEGYEPRRTGAAARHLVEELHKEHGLYSKVIDKLNSDETLAASVREVALQIAQARLAEDQSPYEYPRNPY